jgi:nicotinamide N-methyltransferase
MRATGHKVWNAAKILGEMLEADPSLVQGKNVLELGAGCALPSLLAALNGAKHVVASDYASSTDQVLVEAMQINIDKLVEQESVAKGVLSAVGYVWGQPIEKLLAPLGEEEVEGKRRRKFDVIVCADLIFNRSEHKQLLWTCRECLEEGEGGGEVLVAYSHHDPEKRALDMAFFTLAEQEEEGEEGREGGVGGWVVEDVKMEQCVDLFVEGDGLDEERGKVYVKRLTRKEKKGK